MTIYIDLIFFENVILNFIILLATTLMRKTKMHFWKILLSSILGSVCAILGYFWDYNIIFNIIFKILVSCMMVFIAFENYNKNVFFKNLMFFYLVSFTFGGTAFMFLFFVNPEKLILDAGHFIGTYPTQMSILGGGLGLILILIISKIIKDKFKNLIYDLEIGYKNSKVKLKTLVDSREFIKRTNIWIRCYCSRKKFFN